MDRSYMSRAIRGLGGYLGLSSLEGLGVVVAQGRLTHVCQADAPLAAAESKQAAMRRMELCSCDHLTIHQRPTNLSAMS